MTMEPIQTLNGDFGFTGNDRRFAFSRQASFQQPRTPISTDSTDLGLRKPFLSRTDSSIDIPPPGPHHHYWSGHRYMKRLFFMISLNVAYSTVELLIGLFTGRVGLVSDAVHLTFGCGLLTFSLFVMGASRKKPDGDYTYGYKRLEVLSAFTNAVRSFESFMRFRGRLKEII
ncbi:metal tolerance protein C2-like [Trifolium pratense]|uniref:Metal tolerance protein C2-like n=1 Tax=Trifolium pratense TaxID=57577 RepID=A0A2K3P9D0_TRIPR|nr:metal tolerance protein C2-like [Trifolium pratense]